MDGESNECEGLELDNDSLGDSWHQERGLPSFQAVPGSYQASPSEQQQTRHKMFDKENINPASSFAQPSQSIGYFSGTAPVGRKPVSDEVYYPGRQQPEIVITPPQSTVPRQPQGTRRLRTTDAQGNDTTHPHQPCNSAGAPRRRIPGPAGNLKYSYDGRNLHWREVQQEPDENEERHRRRPPATAGIDFDAIVNSSKYHRTAKQIGVQGFEELLRRGCGAVHVAAASQTVLRVPCMLLVVGQIYRSDTGSATARCADPSGEVTCSFHKDVTAAGDLVPGTILALEHVVAFRPEPRTQYICVRKDCIRRILFPGKKFALSESLTCLQTSSPARGNASVGRRGGETQGASGVAIWRQLDGAGGTRQAGETSRARQGSWAGLQARAVAHVEGEGHPQPPHRGGAMELGEASGVQRGGADDSCLLDTWPQHSARRRGLQEETARKQTAEGGLGPTQARPAGLLLLQPLRENPRPGSGAGKRSRDGQAAGDGSQPGLQLLQPLTAGCGEAGRQRGLSREGGAAGLHLGQPLQDKGGHDIDSAGSQQHVQAGGGVVGPAGLQLVWPLRAHGGAERPQAPRGTEGVADAGMHDEIATRNLLLSPLPSQPGARGPSQSNPAVRPSTHAAGHASRSSHQTLQRQEQQVYVQSREPVGAFPRQNGAVGMRGQVAASKRGPPGLCELGGQSQPPQGAVLKQPHVMQGTGEPEQQALGAHAQGTSMGQVGEQGRGTGVQSDDEQSEESIDVGDLELDICFE